MSKFVLCVDSPGYGGSEKDLIRMLEKINAINFIVYCNPDCDTRLLDFFKSRSFQVNYFYSPNSKKYFLKGIASALKIILKHFKSNFIIWAHHADSNRWLQFSLAILKRKFWIVERHAVPTITSLQNSRMTKPIKKFVYNRTHGIIFCGRDMMNDYRNIFALKEPQNFIFIPNSRDVNKIFNLVSIRRKSKIKENNIYNILSIARLDAQKGIINLLEAFKILKDKKYNINLSVVGDGPEYQSLVKFTKENKIADVMFYGFESDIIPYLSQSDIFILPSLYEGLPGALIEAMAAKLPCIATDISGNRELIINNETGLLVPAKDPVTLAKAIELLISDRTFALKLAEAGYEKVLNNYDEQIEKNGWQNLFMFLKYHNIRGYL